MEKKSLDGFFETFLIKETVFNEKKVLQSSYIPEEILHREKEVNQVANTLAPSLKQEKPSNLFVYGKTGTGKTLSIKYISSELSKMAEKQKIPLKVIYINCKLKRAADTEYRIMAQLLRGFGKEVPPTGLPTEELYKIFYNITEKENQIIILILDEIDYLVKKVGDGILYNLTRMHETSSSDLSLVGISNDVTFVETLDPRVKSSLSEEEIIFPPYNALQIQDILKRRAATAFKSGVLQNGVIEKCAAYAAREHGDARRALELLRVAGELADRNNCKTVSINHIDEAEDKIDVDRIYEVVATQPKQYHLVLYSILSLCKNNNTIVFTGDVYSLYRNYCKKSNTNSLTQRRVSDIIAEFDMLGIIRATTISKGRYGRTREIGLEVENETLARIKSFLETEINV